MITNNLFVHIIQSLQLFTDASRPTSPLTTSIISLRTFDGRLYSNISYSHIQLLFVNLPPILFLPPSNFPVIEESITPSVFLFSHLSPPAISDDSGILDRVSISLLNMPDGDEEFVSFTYNEALAPSLSIYSLNYSSIILQGPAPVSQFISAITTILYTNNKMTNIFSLTPDLTNRIVKIRATDAEGEHSESVELIISFLAICRNVPNVVQISTPNTLKNLSLCEQVQANLEISGDFTSLSLLSRLRIINGSLIFRKVSSLISLSGFENLEFFESISIINVYNLTSTAELGRNVTKMMASRGILVTGNPNLLDLNGFEHISEVMGPIAITSNYLLTDISGLNGLTQVEEIYLISNINLRDITGFSSLLSVNSVYISLNPKLTKINGFNSLINISGLLNIIGNSELISIDGLAGIKFAESVTIAGNNKLCYIGNRDVQTAFEEISTQKIIRSPDNCIPRDCTSEPCLRGQCTSLEGQSFFCICPFGFSGDRCELSNECTLSSPCLNNATCVDKPSGFTCLCLDGYIGDFCQIDIDDCISDPCINGDNCIDLVNSFSCQCPNNFTGKVCQTEIFPCQAMPCQNNGSCEEDGDGYSCDCAPGYTGQMCEADIDECLYLPCVNDGNCINNIGRFTCNCQAGFTGLLCEDDINECTNKPCTNDSQCVNTKGSFACLCPSTVGGEFCEKNIHPCTFMPCLNGLCKQIGSSFECQCNLGYIGNICNIEIDHCENIICRNGVFCQNTLYGYFCDCPSGYSGTLCSTVDACNSNPCLYGGDCFSSGSNYTCQCPAGISGDRLVFIEYACF